MNLDHLRPDRVPASLKLVKQWVLWKFVDRDGEATKVPFQICGRHAKSNDARTWTDFISACQRMGGYAGLGYMFQAGSGVVGIDLDGCRNPDTGEVAEWARDIVQRLNSYAEVSPSKTGIKIWVMATLPGGGAGKKRAVEGAPSVCDKTAAIEIYDRGRYFAVTGWRLGGVSNNVEPRQVELDELLAKHFPKPAPSQIALNGDAEADVIERARAYLQRIPPAISGQGGHNATFKAACVLVLGFGLSEGDAARLMSEWNAGCNPPWSDRDLVRKVREANKQGGERNYLRNATRDDWERIEVPSYAAAPAKQVEQRPAPPTPSVTVTTLENAARAYLSKIEKNETDLVTLGIPEVDAAIGGGVEPGEMVVMAARPSHGKSAIALQFIHHWTANGMPSLFVSEEMSALAVGKRTVQYVSDVPSEYWFKNGEEVRRHIDEHFGQRAPCHIVEGCKSAQRAADEIRKAVAEQGVKCVVVDYAQLLQSAGKSRYEIVTNTSVILRQVATETKCVVVVLAQINRESEKRDVFIPRNSDLKESGQIEQDADVILLLSWPWKMDSKENVNKYQFFIGKNRNREIVKPAVEVMFHPSRQMVTSIPQEEPKQHDALASWNRGDAYEDQ